MPVLIDWPADLPQLFLANGYAESIDSKGMIKSRMDVGPDKRRPRSTLSIMIFTGSMYLTFAQKLSLDYFYKTTLIQGTEKFNFVKPIEQAAIVLRFENTIDYSMIGGLYVNANMAFKEIPGA